ncbi:TetR/AcrR family transcriptional regulator [Hymenobacter sp. BT664]|uniref:TetR/AcrR family transcriptional regulator n=1 Tax=Hymenobacter montanus TaxID=2771359 RepID=A0A927GKU8_9BACT|nr:TetR/AcrR family transcriptional regulator [Hymenobacter montanus]MBD2769511.1 TetR/AcrR family transcriptional regulator [Hymenobacter montanus]
MPSTSKIIDAALRLFVENGFHGTPTSRVASEAGVSNGSLFNAYKTKDDLIVAVYIYVKDELDAHLNQHTWATQSVRERFQQFLTESVRWALANPLAFRFIQQFQASPYQSKLSAEQVQRQTQRHLEALAEGVGAGLLRPLPVPLLFLMVSSQVFALFHFLLLNPATEQEQNHLLEQAAQAVWESISV